MPSPATRASLRRAASIKSPPASKSSPTKRLNDTPQSSGSSRSDLVKLHESGTDELRTPIGSDAGSIAPNSQTDHVEKTPIDTHSDVGSESTPISHSQETQSSSQLTSDEIIFDLEEDSEELNERTNPKTCIERAVEPVHTATVTESGQSYNRQPYNRQQGGQFPNVRGHYPAPYHPYRAPGNENFNPQYPPQFRPPHQMRPGGRPMHPGFGYRFG